MISERYNVGVNVGPGSYFYSIVFPDNNTIYSDSVKLNISHCSALFIGVVQGYIDEHREEVMVFEKILSV
jgi:hypothetical protein